MKKLKKLKLSSKAKSKSKELKKVQSKAKKIKKKSSIDAQVLLQNKLDKDMKKLLNLGLQKKFLTYEEVDEFLPKEIKTKEQIDGVMFLLVENEIEVVDIVKPKVDASSTEDNITDPVEAVTQEDTSKSSRPSY